MRGAGFTGEGKMAYYLKGFLLGLASVGIFFLTLVYLGYYIKVGWFVLTVLLSLSHPGQTGLTAVVDNRSLFARPWFYLWSMIVFASTFLLYLWRTHGL